MGAEHVEFYVGSVFAEPSHFCGIIGRELMASLLSTKHRQLLIHDAGGRGQQQDVRRGGRSERATVGSVLALFLVARARPVGAFDAAMQLFMHAHMDENFKEAKEPKILRRLTFFS